MVDGLKSIFSGIALILTFVAFVPYLQSIWIGKTRPHVFSWVIWGAGTIIVFVAQLRGGAGVGAWPVGLSGLITIMVAALAMAKAGDTSIVPIDWVFLALSASAVPLWMITQTPLSAVVILTLVDLLGFGPSMRKAYHRPWEEHALFFAVGAVRNGFVVLALERYNPTTVLFPAAVGIACALFVVLILTRRTMLTKKGRSSGS